MRKKTKVASAFIFFLTLISIYILYPLFSSSPPFSTIKVQLKFYDYSTNDPIKGLQINSTITTSTQEFHIISGVSDENGNIIQSLPKNAIAKPSAQNISITGLWVLAKTVGEETSSIINKKWTPKNLQSFIYNNSEYVFDKVYLRQERNGSTLILEEDFYLMPATIIEIYDPIQEATTLDSHLRINLLYYNFIKFSRYSRTAIIAPDPLQADFEVNYVIRRDEPLKFKASISIDKENRTFIDLTPYYVTAVSLGQTNEVNRFLENLNQYGFDLTNYLIELDHIINFYNLAIEKYQNNDFDGFRINLQSAMNSYRVLYDKIAGMYVNGIGWIPSLIIMFLFFSISLSKMITNKNFSIPFFVLFIAIFCLFYFTQPYLRLFITNPSILVESFTVPLIFDFLLQLLPIALILIISCFGQIRTFLWETFEVSVRNLKRRKLKTVLALSTIIIVATSSMCLLTVATNKLTLSMIAQKTTPIVERGLVIYKLETQVPFTYGSQGPFIYPLTIQQYELKWFSGHEWVEAINVYGLVKVNFARSDGYTIKGFNEFNLIVVNASFMDYYQKVSDVLGIKWFENVDRNMVIIGSRIAEEYNLESGSEVLINGKIYNVKSIVDEKTAVQKLQEIDGDLFLYMVYDRETGKIDGESFIFGDTKDFGNSGFLIYKISVILKNDDVQNLNQIVEETQSFGFDYGETDDYSYIVTYSMRVISPNSVYLVYSGAPSNIISGETPIVPIIIATLMLFVNMMGTVYERKSEIKTIHIIGASPLRISLIYITEGLVFGIIGGIFSYILGFIIVQNADISLPTLVSENMIGGAPFVITVSIAVFTSLLGCLYPSRESMTGVVPSGRMRHKTKDLLEIRDGIAYMQIPVKIEVNEIGKFKSHLEGLARETTMIIGISSLTIEEKNGGISLFFMADKFKSYEMASFLVSIQTTPNKSLEVTIQPLDDNKNKTRKWKRKHKENINELSEFLRKEILGFKIAES